MVQTIPTPYSLGLPSKFKSWRPNQWQAIIDGLECEKRAAVQVQRGGRGKTTTYMTQALLDNDSRVVILTQNKGLQDQALEDWGEMGLVDIRGRSSYACDGLPGHTCEDGSVSKCMYRGTSMCGANNAISEAKKTRMLISNYSCWMASNKYGQGFGSFDRMICDEAHNIPQEVAKAMRVQISDRDLQLIKREWPDDRNDMLVWKKWAAVTLIISDTALEPIKEQIEKPGRPSPGLVAKYKSLRNLSRKLADIATCRTDRWICDSWLHGYQFDVVDSRDYVERILFRKIPKLILTSGTIRPRTVDLCGLEPQDYEFFDYPSDINADRSPLYHVKTGIRMNKNTPDYHKLAITRWIDKIIEGRQDRKGIIHTANFKLRDFIHANSKFRVFMDTNYQGQDRMSDIIDRFKRRSAPAVLISPSATTGFDFPYDLCRYQIIAKLPFEDLGNEVTKARMALDPDYAASNMMQNLAQAFSRGDRGDDDQQEVFVLDDNIGQAMWRYRDLAPSWLPAYFSVIHEIPIAPEMEVAR